MLYNNWIGQDFKTPLLQILFHISSIDEQKHAARFSFSKSALSSFWNTELTDIKNNFKYRLFSMRMD